MRGWRLRSVSNKDWWGGDGRSAREYSEALLVMQGEPERQRGFLLVHVPEHLHDLVRSHYKTALQLQGGKK